MSKTSIQEIKQQQRGDEANGAKAQSIRITSERNEAGLKHDIPPKMYKILKSQNIKAARKELQQVAKSAKLAARQRLQQTVIWSLLCNASINVIVGGVVAITITITIIITNFFGFSYFP